MLTEEVKKAGGTAERASHWNGCDLSTNKGLSRLLSKIDELCPRTVLFAPPCGPESPIQNLNQRTPSQIEQLAAKRHKSFRIQKLIKKAIRYCMRKGCRVILEQLVRCGSWKHTPFEEILSQLFHADVKGCMVGLVSKEGDRIFKPWRFVSDDPNQR